MPGGRVRLISSILASTAAATVRLLPPISISAVPSTTSWPFSLALPVRSSRPIVDLATSLTWIGMPPRVGDHDVADLGERLEPPAGAHHIAFAVALDVAGAAARHCWLRSRSTSRRTRARRPIELRDGSGCTWYCLT